MGLDKAIRWLAALPIRAYQVTLAYFFGGHCRFTPSCSAYALEAVRHHGAIKGWVLALRRLARCHPFSTGGHDPVPPVDDAPACHAASAAESPKGT
jgi:putative membrane protein insertion efficiency factor